MLRYHSDGKESFSMCESVGFIPRNSGENDGKEIFFIGKYYIPSWIWIRFKILMQKAPTWYIFKMLLQRFSLIKDFHFISRNIFVLWDLVITYRHHALDKLSVSMETNENKQLIYIILHNCVIVVLWMWFQDTRISLWKRRAFSQT